MAASWLSVNAVPSGGVQVRDGVVNMSSTAGWSSVIYEGIADGHWKAKINSFGTVYSLDIGIAESGKGTTNENTLSWKTHTLLFRWSAGMSYVHEFYGDGDSTRGDCNRVVHKLVVGDEVEFKLDSSAGEFRVSLNGDALHTIASLSPKTWFPFVNCMGGPLDLSLSFKHQRTILLLQEDQLMVGRDMSGEEQFKIAALPFPSTAKLVLEAVAEACGFDLSKLKMYCGTTRLEGDSSVENVDGIVISIMD